MRKQLFFKRLTLTTNCAVQEFNTFTSISKITTKYLSILLPQEHFLFTPQKLLQIPIPMIHFEKCKFNHKFPNLLCISNFCSGSTT